MFLISNGLYLILYRTHVIYCLYKDDKGNIFGGSIHSGLFLAIGNYIKTYKNTQYSQPEGLSELTVTALHEDSDTLLWIGTDGGGLNTYHQHTGKFQHFSSTNEKKIVSIASYSIPVFTTDYYSIFYR